jgi:surfeit locus 1 family protein
MTLATIVVMALCIKAGLWQLNRAEAKRVLQMQLNARQNEPSVALTDKMASLKKVDSELWRFRRVKFSGTYDTRYQVLLDNQVENTAAGYHVLTPVHVEGSKAYVLVNRGWIAGTPDRKVPEVTTPQGVQIIEGDIALPPAKFFTLEALPLKQDKLQQVWQSHVWQNMDMQLYAKSVPFAIQPFVVRLNANSNAGGFVRNWAPPGERVAMHLGYAYQWFGFALTMLVIFIVLNVKQNSIKQQSIEKVER